MFHQANMRVDAGTGKSLVMMWVDAVTSEAAKRLTWPIRSLGLDGLMAAYQAREARDKCKLSYRLSIGQGGALDAITVVGKGPSGTACVAPLMAPDGVSARLSGGAAIAGQRLGAEPQTFRLSLKAGATNAVKMFLTGAQWM
jgi:hypothetical protein